MRSLEPDATTNSPNPAGAAATALGPDEHRDTATSAVVAHGTKSLAVSQMLTQVTRFGTNLVLARLLAPNAFGIVAIVLVIAAFLDQVKDMGTGSALIQQKKLTGDLLNTVFYLNALLGLILAATVFVSAGVIADLLSAHSSVGVLRVFAIATIVTSLGQVHHAMLRRNLRFGVLAKINAANAVCTATVSIVGAIAGFGVWALVVGYLAGYILDTALVWLCDDWRPGRRVSVESLRSIAHYSVHLFGVNVTGFFFGQADKLMVSRFLGATPLGVYSMAQRILTYPMSSISNVVGEVLFPALAQKQDDDERLRTGYVRSTRVVALVTFPLMAVAAAAARPAVDTVLGPAWADLTPLIWILAPIGALQSVAFNAGQLLMAKGRTDILFRWTAGSTVLIIASYVIGLHWGLIGLCVCYAVVVVALIPFNLLIAFRLVDLRLTRYARELAPMALAAAAAAGAVLAINTFLGPRVPGAAVLIVDAIIGVGVYAGAIALIRPPALVDALAALRARRPGLGRVRVPRAAVGVASVAIIAVAAGAVLVSGSGIVVLAALIMLGVVTAVALSQRDACAVLTLMVALLFLLPEDYVLVGPLKSVGNPALLVGMGALAVWVAGRALRLTPSRRDHPVHWLMCAYGVAAALAFAAAMTRALTSIESSGATRAVFPVLAEMGIALLACDALLNRRRLDDLLYRLVILVGISAVIGVAEFAIPTFKYMTMVHVPGLTVNVDVIQDVRSSFRRVQAAASHPIEYAVGTAAMVPLGLHYATHSVTRGARQLAGAATLAMLVVLPMSVSRSAVLAVGVALLVYAVQWSGRTKLNALVLAVIGLIGFRAVVPGLLGTLRSLLTVGSADPSITGRTEDYAHIPGLMSGHWLFGRGLGTFQAAQYFYLDNQYLGSLLEGGIIGLVMLVVLFVVGMGIARGARKVTTDPATRSLGQALAAGIAALTASAGTFDELGFKQTAFLLFLFIGSAGALWRMGRSKAEVPSEPTEETETTTARSGSLAPNWTR